VSKVNRVARDQPGVRQHGAEPWRVIQQHPETDFGCGALGPRLGSESTLLMMWSKRTGNFANICG